MTQGERPLAIITGGTSGIGLAAANALRETHQLALIYSRNIGRAEEVERQLQRFTVCKCWQVDVSIDRAVEVGVSQIFDFYGRSAEVLLNSAGIIADPIFFVQQKSLEHHKTLMEVNYFGTLRMIHSVLPQMYQRRSGSIINVSSNYAEGGILGSIAYSASKAAVELLTRNLAVETGHRGISVNCIRPGLTQTPMTLPFMKKSPAPKVKFNLPLGRPLMPEEIARAIVAILSLSPTLNGQVIAVDGGTSVRRTHGMMDF